MSWCCLVDTVIGYDRGSISGTDKGFFFWLSRSDRLLEPNLPRLQRVKWTRRAFKSTRETLSQILKIPTPFSIYIFFFEYRFYFSMYILCMLIYLVRNNCTQFKQLENGFLWNLIVPQCYQHYFIRSNFGWDGMTIRDISGGEPSCFLDEWLRKWVVCQASW